MRISLIENARMINGDYYGFDTAIGRCGIAWGAAGVLAIELPGPATSKPRGHSCEPPSEIAQAVTGIRRLLRGEPVDLKAVKLDMSGLPAFHHRVFEVTRTIPPGQVRSYAQIAEQLGARGLARAVGRALAQNPFPLVVPCHRVVAAGGKLGGFSAPGGLRTKLRLLQIEGARLCTDTLFPHDPRFSWSGTLVALDSGSAVAR